MKRLINFKSILVSLIAVIVLIFAGIYTIDKQVGVEEKQSSYKQTAFDYIAVSPSKEQVASFSENTEAIERVFPCYNFEISVLGKTSSTINFLMSDTLDGYNISLFNEKLLLQGSFDSSGIMIDEKTADLLNVKVGDSVTFGLNGKAFSLKVAGIYRQSTYRGLDRGLALATFTQEMKDAFSKEIAYNLAFIDAKDIDKCNQLFVGYIPYGQLLSQEDYLLNYKKNNNLPPNMTETEWDNSIIVKYNEYKENFLSQTFKDVIQIKSNYMEDVKEQVASTEIYVKNIGIGVAIASATMFSLFLTIFIFMNKKDDELFVSDGASVKKLFVIDCLRNAVYAIVTSGAVFGGLYFYALSTGYVLESLKTICLFSLPILVSIVVTVIASFVYAKGFVNDEDYYEKPNFQIPQKSENNLNETPVGNLVFPIDQIKGTFEGMTIIYIDTATGNRYVCEDAICENDIVTLIGARIIK